MTVPPLRVLRDGYPEAPGMDTALSRALLQRVSAGTEPETVRFYTPGRIVAFGKRDVVSRGYPAAVAAARERGFSAIERLAGGRAAVFHPGTIAIAWTSPDHDPPAGIRARFTQMAGLVAAALGRLGVDARIGEVAGEYCSGEYSVNARGATKIMGVGQRLAKHAAHVGGVLVVSGAAAVRDVLVPVYDALSIEWDPETTGSVEDEIGPVRPDLVVGAILSELGERRRLIDGRAGAEVLAAARRLAPEHVAGAVVGRGVDAR